MACSKEHLCLKLHDRIKVMSHGDKSAVFPSFLRIICSGCCAVAAFSLRNDGFAVPMVGSATCWTGLSGRTSRCPGHSHSQGMCTQYSLQREECYKSPVFCKFSSIRGQLQCSTEPRERHGLTGPYFSFPTP